MGSWNVTCCLTKTPISPGERCVLLRFVNNAESTEDLQFLDLEGFLENVIPHLISVHHGTYTDYGRISSLKTDVCPLTQDKYYGFFLSLAAWEFCSKLPYAWVDKHIDQKIKVAKAEIEFELVDHKHGAVELPIDKSIQRWFKQFIKFEAEARIIGRIVAFGQANLFNVFDLSNINMYAGQKWDKAAQQQWMDLRSQIIQKQ